VNPDADSKILSDIFWMMSPLKVHIYIGMEPIRLSRINISTIKAQELYSLILVVRRSIKNKTQYKKIIAVRNNAIVATVSLLIKERIIGRTIKIPEI